jgi:hypothetical protein
MAVVDDADELGPAFFEIDFDSRCAGVQAVFEQFFDDAGRPLDYLAGRDLRDDFRR